LHSLHGGGSGKRSRVWERIQQEFQTEEMVAMGMSDVNGYEILSALDEPVDEFLRMFNGQKRIDKDGIAFTMNQCDGVGNPGQILLARPKSLSNAGTLLRQELPIQLCHKAFLS